MSAYSAVVDERRLLEQVASDYRARGYEVIVEPAPRTLPEPLRRFRPDLIAHGPDETLVIEVKRPDAPVEAANLSGLVEAAKQCGWRVALHPVPLSATADVMGPAHVADWADAAANLLEQNLIEQALVVAFPALEAVLNRLAADHSLHADRWSMERVLRELVAQDALSEAEFQLLDELWRVRSVVVHGRVVEIPGLGEKVRELIAVVRWYAEHPQLTVSAVAGALETEPDESSRRLDGIYPGIPTLIQEAVVRSLRH